jgi:hypothetical protein
MLIASDGFRRVRLVYPLSPLSRARRTDSVQTRRTRRTRRAETSHKQAPVALSRALSETAREPTHRLSSSLTGRWGETRQSDCGVSP